MAIHSSIPAWRIPWTKEPGRLQRMGSQRVGHDLVNEQQQIPYDYTVEMTNRFKGLDLVDRVP